jgi:ankyrin repeat protein
MPINKIAQMRQPKSLQTEAYNKWGRGRGIDIWNMICASITGDLDTIKKLVARDPQLVNCEKGYLTPLYFAARENQKHVVEFLLANGVGAAFEAGDDILTIVRDRGYTELTDFFEKQLRDRYQIMPGGEEIAALIRAFDKNAVRQSIEENPALVHVADKRGNKPIHWASLTRQIDLIDFLLNKGADIDARRPDGARAIDLTNGDYHYRNWYRDLPATGLQSHALVVGYLLARGAYCDISVAAKMGYYDRVKQLLEENPGLANEVPEHNGYYSGYPLRNAAAAGHMEIVKLLLQYGANPNTPEPGMAPDGSALHNAIGGKRWAIVKLLLEHGANPNGHVESSGNCIWRAKHVGAPQEVIDLIASYGGAPGLELITYDGDVSVMATLLRVNPQMEIPEDALGDALEHRLLMELILRYQPRILEGFSWGGNGDPDNARWLIKNGLDVKQPDWMGATMLHHVAGRGDIKMAEVCLEAGADINTVETNYSSTPLGWAARTGKTEMVKWLVEKGADSNLPADESWARPLEWAKRRGHTDIAAFLAAPAARK